MDDYLKPSDAAKHFGVAVGTLRKWERSGLIKCIRTKAVGGQRRYNIRSFKNADDYLLSGERASESTTVVPGKERYCYCRVSSSKQKDDLERQAEYLQSVYPSYKVIKDVGSGLNYKRKGLLSILERAHSGLVSEVVVAHKDRLCRFGFELLQWFFVLYGVKLIVLQEDNISRDEELARDILDVVHVFACRANGKRKYKTRQSEKQTIEEDQESDKKGPE